MSDLQNYINQLRTMRDELLRLEAKQWDRFVEGKDNQWRKLFDQLIGLDRALNLAVDILLEAGRKE